MSVENGKVCCNCKYRRDRDDNNEIYCWCNFTGRYLSYAELMTGWCRHWAKEKEKLSDTDESDAEFMCRVMSKTINKSTDDRNFIGRC